MKKIKKEIYVSCSFNNFINFPFSSECFLFSFSHTKKTTKVQCGERAPTFYSNFV